MFTKLECFRFKKIELIDIYKEVYSYQIKGYSKTINSKEISLILDEESESFEVTKKQLDIFREKNKMFKEIILHLENEAITIPFKYVGREELFYDYVLKSAKELDIHLLFE